MIMALAEDSEKFKNYLSVAVCLAPVGK